MNDIFELENYHVKNKELGKLISYAYDLHERDFERYCDIPTFKFVNLGSIIPNAVKTTDGGIYGWRIYADHSTDTLLTQIGVFKNENGNLVSYFLETDNQDYDTNSSRTKLSEDGYFDFDTSDGYSKNVTPEEFIEAMVMLGFKKDDVVAVAEGRMTAKEAFRKVAPESIKNIEWLNIGRKQYVFDGNVAISGHFGTINVDKFPFPFGGQPIFDCAKVSTWYMEFGSNKRRAKLINVNKNRDSIKYSDLRAAIIDEPIDLSLVDATDTIFGHQVVINPEYSIAPLKEVNLALAVDENGNKYVTDADGHIVDEWFPETDEVAVERGNKEIKVLANADNVGMVQMAIENGAEGIGLVRTENALTSCNIAELKSFMHWDSFYDYDESLDVLRRLIEDQIKTILSVANGQKVVIRLFDYKFEEFMRLAHTSLEGLELTETPDVRGTKGLLKRDILSTQLDVLMKLASRFQVELNILVPMIEDTRAFEYIKNEIVKESENYDIPGVRIGAMIENLHSMNYADELARNADFVSIGTNDLTESITGLSRHTHAEEFHLLSDRVKEAIKEIIFRVRAVKPEIEIGICGEHTNYSENLEFLSGLNIDYITCAPAYVKLNQKMLSVLQPPRKTL